MFYKAGKLPGYLLAILLLLSPCLLYAAEDKAISFDNWVEYLKKQAIGKGISPETINTSLQNLQPMQQVADFQASTGNYFLEQYLTMALSPQQQNYQAKLLQHYSNILFEISHLFGVEPEVLIAVWSLDNMNAQNRQQVLVIPLLVSSSFKQPRNKQIQNELFAALKLIDDKQVDPNNFTSDEHGLLGTVYFRPSTLRNHGIDYDGDGKINIWNDYADIFASAANYLSSIGWKNKESWGMEVQLPDNLPPELLNANVQRSINYWQAQGIRLKNGAELPLDARLASLIKPEPFADIAILALDNYFALLRWKRSNAFAIAVGLSIDKLKPSQNNDEPATPFLTH
ncbi:MAG: lytic murein transglycosylase [Gammaproteobacteria bacterium]|nr:lytic murein transglycosylase [Gammaproteobacteria bacterium]